MAQVRIISTDIIKSVNKNGEISTDRKRVELTPWDLDVSLSTVTTQCGLLFHKPKSSTPSINLIHHLKLTLARTLDFYPPLAGRLRLVTNDDDGTSSFFIDCNNAGALFLYATADHVMVRDIDTPDVPPVLSSFFHFLVRLCYEGTSKPLLAVQVTELADGVFIACTVNTLLVDASSFWHFLTSWSEISRGLNNISRSPVIDRWFPSDVNFPIRLPFSPEGLKVASADNHLPLEEWHFHFTKEKIAALKAKSNAEMRTTSISPFQALLAARGGSLPKN